MRYRGLSPVSGNRPAGRVEPEEPLSNPGIATISAELASVGARTPAGVRAGSGTDDGPHGGPYEILAARSSTWPKSRSRSPVPAQQRRDRPRHRPGRGAPATLSPAALPEKAG